MPRNCWISSLKAPEGLFAHAVIRPGGRYRRPLKASPSSSSGPPRRTVRPSPSARRSPHSPLLCSRRKPTVTKHYIGSEKSLPPTASTQQPRHFHGRLRPGLEWTVRYHSPRPGRSGPRHQSPFHKALLKSSNFRSSSRWMYARPPLHGRRLTSYRSVSSRSSVSRICNPEW